MRITIFLAALAAVATTALGVAPASAGGFGSETYPVSTTGSVVFFDGSLGGESDLTLTGSSPYAYNPANGNLVMEVIVTNQEDVCNGCGNGFMLADYTGSQVVRAVDATGAGVYNGTGALVTTFNGSLTLGSPDSGNCYPFDCNDSGSSTGQSFDYYEVFNAADFGGPISISSLGFQQWSGDPGSVMTGDYEVFLGVEAGVPEPAQWALLLVGVGGIGGALRLARRKDGPALTAA